MPPLEEIRAKKKELNQLIRQAEKMAGNDRYARHREDMGQRQRAATLSGQKIVIPEVNNRPRREEGLSSFNAFCKIYGQTEFYLPWSDFHRKAIDKIELAVMEDHWFAFGFPRGSGKTTIAEWGVIWALLTGQRPYVLFIGASQTLAERQLQTIKTTLSTNELLEEDFPHAVYPIVALEGEPRRARGQRNAADGKHTLIEWGPNRVVFPQVEHPDSLCSGAIIEAYGLETAKRGIKFKRRDGTTIRPSFVIADDPQTRDSAASASQSQRRLENLTGDVAYLAGPSNPISLVCPCTVIYENDLADQILNRENHPEWHGERTKMVESFPTNMELWDQYADILRNLQREDADIRAATDFYGNNREAMDEGAKVSWPERFRDDELSGIQHAMNLKIRDEAAFFSECQNEPIQQQDDLELMSPDEIAAKVMGYTRGQVPAECSLVTAFTDVQKDHLFWVVCAWAPDFTGYVIDYGAWPEQKRTYFTRRDIRRKLSHQYTGDESGMMFAALTDLGQYLAGTTYKRTDGTELALGRWCIDANWRDRERAVQAYAKQSEYASVITLTYGRGVKATQPPFSEAQRAIRWRTGPGWFWIDSPGPARGVAFDTNLWKKRLHDALTLSVGSRGSIQLYKAGLQTHRMLADHLTAEKPVKTMANGRTVYEWQEKPGRDNEGLDCLVGCMLGASINGIVKEAEVLRRKPEGPPKSLADLAAKRTHTRLGRR